MNAPLRPFDPDMIAVDDLVSEGRFTLSETLSLTVRLCWRHFVPDPYQKFGYRAFFSGATIEEMRREIRSLNRLVKKAHLPSTWFRGRITIEEMQELAQMSVSDVHYLERYETSFPDPRPRNGRLWVSPAAVETLRRLRPVEPQEH